MKKNGLTEEKIETILSEAGYWKKGLHRLPKEKGWDVCKRIAQKAYTFAALYEFNEGYQYAKREKKGASHG